MGGMFGVVSEIDCVMDLFYGTDYHSHLGTRRGGMAVCNEADGVFTRFIHNIENAPSGRSSRTIYHSSPATWASVHQRHR